MLHRKKKIIIIIFMMWLENKKKALLITTHTHTRTHHKRTSWSSRGVWKFLHTQTHIHIHTTHTDIMKFTRRLEFFETRKRTSYVIYIHLHTTQGHDEVDAAAGMPLHTQTHIVYNIYIHYTPHTQTSWSSRGGWNFSNTWPRRRDTPCVGKWACSALRLITCCTGTLNPKPWALN